MRNVEYEISKYGLHFLISHYLFLIPTFKKGLL
jgi:hypothetical protein